MTTDEPNTSVDPAAGGVHAPKKGAAPTNNAPTRTILGIALASARSGGATLAGRRPSINRTGVGAAPTGRLSTKATGAGAAPTGDSSTSPAAGGSAPTDRPSPGAMPASPTPASAPSAKKSSSGGSQASHAFAATRSVARKLALQALYRWQLNDGPWQDLVQEFGEAEDMPNADREYFRELVEGVWGSRQALDTRLAELMDRPPEQLDPVEHAVLLIGLYELTSRPEVPYRVSINEAVGLTKRFGATDGHKFVNAVLDRAARTLRPDEN